MRIILLLALLAVFSFVEFGFSQTDDVGAGHAILFDGIDDYIDLGDIYDEVDLPITISAWIYVDADANVIQYPIFDSQDNSSVYNGFTFVCSTLPHVGFTIGDGKGGNNPAFRRSRAGYFEGLGRWIYITATARSGYDIELYMNGHLLSGEYQGTSPYKMNSYSPTEVAKIGYLFSNGLTFRFKGVMDELRIWNRALSENEIRESMCRKLTGNESGLIGYWTFDETSGDILKDKSPKGYNGTLKGNPTRVFSGAPVGDESVFLYSDYWSGKSVAKDSVSVANISGHPYGVHIYKVNSPPSQTQGLTADDGLAPYYGVFLADDGSDNLFDLRFGQAAVCSSFQRRDNSEPAWTKTEMFSQIHSRTEVIPTYKIADLNVDLGDDALVCNAPSFDLAVNTDPAMKSFLWNTGQTTQSITVNSSGVYSVEVRQDCIIDRDTITVTLLNSPPAFSLGADEEVCSMKPRTLDSSLESHGLDFTWQDGSKNTALDVNDFGTYWLQVKNLCGISADTITFKQKVLTDFRSYNFISPNDDNYNQYFVVDDPIVGGRLEVFNRWGKEVYQSPSYHNDWSGRGLPAGIYFYVVYGQCFEPQKGTVTIMR